jgi:hypothetical protein
MTAYLVYPVGQFGIAVVERMLTRSNNITRGDMSESVEIFNGRNYAKLY